MAPVAPPGRRQGTPFIRTASRAFPYRRFQSRGGLVPPTVPRGPRAAPAVPRLPSGGSGAAMEGEPPPVEERRRLQQELNEFVESCCRTLEEVTASLGWSLDRLDPGEEAAEVRGACARVLLGALSLRSSVAGEESAWELPPVCGACWAPGTGPGAPWTPAGLGWRTGTPSAELRLEEKVKMRWVRRGGRSGL